MPNIYFTISCSSGTYIRSIAADFGLKLGTVAHLSALTRTQIGDFNIKMLRTCETLGGKLAKRHITYRKLFDETKEFKRHPVVD